MSPDGSPASTKTCAGRIARAHPRPLDADHEQAGRVGGLDRALALDDQAVAGVHRDPGEPGGGRGADRRRADRRQIGAALLARLLELDQHAARPLAAQLAAAREQPVGALDRLDAEHQALLHDHRLADVELAEAGRDLDAERDVALGRRVGRGPGHQALGREQAAGDLVGADHAEALGLELARRSRRAAGCRPGPRRAEPELGRPAACRASRA